MRGSCSVDHLGHCALQCVFIDFLEIISLSPFTLRPSWTLLFSRLSMMIWQKNISFKYRWWSEKKVVKWQKLKNALWDLTEKLLLLNVFSMQFWTEITNQSGSRIHAWILLEKKIYCIRIYSIFCRESPFYREWPQLVTILRSFNLPFV